MENMKYAEELVREFLVFRGFTKTLRAYESDLSTDIGKGFQAHKITDLVFSVYVPKFEFQSLVGLLNFLKQCFFSPNDAHLNSTMAKLEVSILKYYIVFALQRNRQDKVVEFFNLYGNELLQTSDDWTPWFALPYLKNPSIDPRFRVYFSKEWLDALLISFRNFLSQVLNGDRLPALLRVALEQINIRSLKKEIAHLHSELSQMRQLLESKEAEVSLLKNSLPSEETERMQETFGKTAYKDRESQGTLQQREESESSCISFTKFLCDRDGRPPSILDDEHSTSRTSDEDSNDLPGGKQNQSSTDMKNLVGAKFDSDPHCESCEMEGLSEVTIAFQEIFSGHTSPIARCRFSAEGTNVASASVDGTVRIWTYESSASTSRNAAICCGAEIMSLDWEYKFDRLLLIGTAEGGIKAWNVDAKRVVCDLNTGTAFPYVLDLKCSPVDSLFVSAAASRGQNNVGLAKLGYASLTAWNMKTWKPLTVFPLGEDPPAITSVCFNHNGKILAASATDGMIHMFDMSAGLPITGWPAHDSSITCVKFGPDEASIFSLGSDGKVIFHVNCKYSIWFLCPL